MNEKPKTDHSKSTPGYFITYVELHHFKSLTEKIFALAGALKKDITDFEKTRKTLDLEEYKREPGK